MSIRILDYRPPRIAQVLVLAAALLHWATPLKQLQVYSSHWLGLLVGAAGFAVMMWGWWLFRKYDTAICPGAKPRRLIVSGVYRLSRNPMYLGMVAMLFGIAIYVGSFPFYLAAAIYLLVIDRFFCSCEESRLLDAFGDEYLAYKNRVRRWI
ncbi:MAG: isoprenylcysteine carboxylmethyltransferase family protein [Gammaproteobacteria bacterium]|jgi:protein-S-isoprenylcysteine O-methyltransferase Ste14